MRSKHLSVRKCIDKKPDKIKGIDVYALFWQLYVREI